jgi:hypothetical protein
MPSLFILFAVVYVLAVIEKTAAMATPTVIWKWPQSCVLVKLTCVQWQVCLVDFKLSKPLFVKGHKEGENMTDWESRLKAIVTSKDQFCDTADAVAASAGVVGPAWTRGKIEKPAGTKNMGGWVAAVYTPEQQARLSVDEWGNTNEASPTQRLLLSESGVDMEVTAPRKKSKTDEHLTATHIKKTHKMKGSSGKMAMHKLAAKAATEKWQFNDATRAASGRARTLYDAQRAAAAAAARAFAVAEKEM